jgi:hypothetical protein|tara:strand:+ start:41 stop:301 length:261 start_codon:yes stop_codon:yes gene_type:complete
MKKDNFYKLWSIALIIILVIGMIYMFWEFRQIDRDGIACKSQPFIWGAQQMTSRPNVEHMSCSCAITGEDYFKPYSFNEEQENPFP